MDKSQTVEVDSVKIANHLPLVVIAGPCVIENRDHALKSAERLTQITDKLNLGLIYKSSFDKANRTSLASSRGIGIETGLAILAQVKQTIGCPVVTDVHDPGQCLLAAQTVDMIQIPAFLSRQTDLLLAAGESAKPLLVKKGQFLSPWDMSYVIEKIASTANHRILLCERGVMFGYNNLVCDFRSLLVLAESGYPVVFDATHGIQEPGGRKGGSGGDRRFAFPLARAAVAVGIAAIFLEVHENPDSAPSDSATMLPLADLPSILERLRDLDLLTKEYRDSLNLGESIV